MTGALLLVLAVAAAPDEGGRGDRYLGWNPLAALTALPSKPAKIIVPMLSDMEFGLALRGGMVLADRHGLDARLAFGSPHGLDFSLLPQLRLGYGFFLLNRPLDRSRGPHVGMNLRLWDLYYRTSQEHYFSVMPGLDLGWWWDVGSHFVDLRFNLTWGACSWSSQENTSGACDLFLSPAPDMMPVLPLVGCDVGYSW